MQPAAVLGALPLAYAPLLLEHGGESEGAQSGDTDFVTSGGESELSGEDNGGDAFANAVLALVDHSAGSSVTPPMTPRLQSILGSMAISPVRSVRSSMEAVAMDVDTFGESTEAVRSRAIDEAVAGSTNPPPPTQMAVVLSLPSSAALTAGAPMVMERAVPPAGAQLFPMVLERAVLPAGKQPFPIVHASTSSAVLESEDRAAALAADELMRVTPVELAFHLQSDVPIEQRMANRRRHLAGLGVGSLRKGIQTCNDWLAFVQRHQLPHFGIPIDGEKCLWFLRELDEVARANAKGGRSGASAEHAGSTSMRWLADNNGMPFTAAKEINVRKASAPQREQEPAWAQMWEVASIIHLLRIACLYRGPFWQFVCAYAAGGYAVAVASLRLVDGERSPPPRLDEEGRLRSVAAISKGKRRAVMRPLPWLIPTVSPDPGLTDEQVRVGLVEAFALLPPNACSMFMGMLNGSRRVCSLPTAAEWTSTRATPARIISAFTHLFQWYPLSYSREMARRVARKKHGPRHFLPELGRVVVLPQPARDELGYWKGVCGSRGRIGQNSNRYSRDGEVYLQNKLRSYLLLWIRSRFPAVFARLPLDHFGATVDEMRAAESFGKKTLDQATLI